MDKLWLALAIITPIVVIVAWVYWDIKNNIEIVKEQNELIRKDIKELYDWLDNRML